MTMAKNTKKGSGGSKGRPVAKPNIPRAGIKTNGSRYGCGGKKGK